MKILFNVYGHHIHIIVWENLLGNQNNKGMIERVSTNCSEGSCSREVLAFWQSLGSPFYRQEVNIEPNRRLVLIRFIKIKMKWLARLYEIFWPAFVDILAMAHIDERGGGDFNVWRSFKTPLPPSPRISLNSPQVFTVNLNLSFRTVFVTFRAI